MALPLALLPYLTPPYTKWDDAAGMFVPNAGGFIYTFQTDLTTPQTVWTDRFGTVPYSNPIELDDDGWPASTAIYVNPNGYYVKITDSDGVLLKDVLFVEDVGSAFLATQANIQAQGTTAVASPYTVDTTDNLVIVDSATNPFIVQLPAASARGTQLIVKNSSAGVVVRVTPDGTDTIENINAYYAIPAAVSPLSPTIILLSDGVSAWWIAGGIGL